MDVDENTDDWLGCPTPLEMYKHQCALLVDELVQTQGMLRKSHENIEGLVQMNDALSTGKALAEKELAKAKSEIAQLNYKSWELGNKINSLKIVADGRDHLFRENQRLLMELKVLSPPSP